MKIIALCLFAVMTASGQNLTVTVSARETVDLIEPATGLTAAVDAVKVRVEGLPRDAQVYRVTLIYEKEGVPNLTMAQRGLTRQVLKRDATGLAAWTETAPLRLLFPIGEGATARLVRVETFIGTRTSTKDVEVPQPR